MWCHALRHAAIGPDRADLSGEVVQQRTRVGILEVLAEADREPAQQTADPDVRCWQSQR